MHSWWLLSTYIHVSFNVDIVLYRLTRKSLHFGLFSLLQDALKFKQKLTDCVPVQLHRCLISFDGLIRSASNLHTFFLSYCCIERDLTPPLHISWWWLSSTSTSDHRWTTISSSNIDLNTSSIASILQDTSVSRRARHNSEGILIIVNHTTKLYVFHRYLLILKRYDPQSCRSHRECHATST